MQAGDCVNGLGKDVWLTHAGAVSAQTAQTLLIMQIVAQVQHQLVFNTVL
jgi:hypothetical protein